MKQKFVIKVSMNGLKSRSKALKTVVGLPGVESATLVGKDKNQIEAVGDGVDPVELTTLLRKRKAKRSCCLRFGAEHVELVKVERLDKKEGEGGEKMAQPTITEYDMPQGLRWAGVGIRTLFSLFHDHVRPRNS